MQVTSNVLKSSAVAVLCDREHAGLDLAVVDGRLRVWPVERLTPEHEHLIRLHRNELVALVRICDEGVQERLVAYKQQLAKVPKGSTPDFVFQRGTPYAKAVCFSCGATLPEPRVWPLLALFTGLADGCGGADPGGAGGGVCRGAGAGVTSEARGGRSGGASA